MAIMEWCGYCGCEFEPGQIRDPEYDMHNECVRDWLCIDEDEKIEREMAIRDLANHDDSKYWD